MNATDRERPLAGAAHRQAEGNGSAQERSALYTFGCLVSAWVSDVFAHPATQLGFIIVCIAWFLSAWPTDLLTAALSIMAITLTQMVLNRQNEREAEAHRRDIAMHNATSGHRFRNRTAPASNQHHSIVRHASPVPNGSWGR